MSSPSNVTCEKENLPNHENNNSSRKLDKLHHEIIRVHLCIYIYIYIYIYNNFHLNTALQEQLPKIFFVIGGFVGCIGLAFTLYSPRKVTIGISI